MGSCSEGRVTSILLTLSCYQCLHTCEDEGLYGDLNFPVPKPGDFSKKDVEITRIWGLVSHYQSKNQAFSCRCWAHRLGKRSAIILEI